MSKLLVLLKFGFMKLVDKSLEIFDGGRLTYINSFEHSLKKKKTFPFSLPPTQHHSFFFIETKHLLSLLVDFSLKCYFIIGNNKKINFSDLRALINCVLSTKRECMRFYFLFLIAFQTISDMKNGVQCCKHLRSKLEEKK